MGNFPFLFCLFVFEMTLVLFLENVSNSMGSCDHSASVYQVPCSTGASVADQELF